MVRRREAQGLVDRYQRMGCLEAVRRRPNATCDEVSRWCGLPMADVLRHLHALERDGEVVRRGMSYRTAPEGMLPVRSFASIA